MTRQGNVYDLCVYRQLISGVGLLEMADGAPLPPLAVGNYVMEYSEATTWDDGSPASCVHKLTRQFSVIPQSYLTYVVEYYNASLDHYFLTADAGERTALDEGTIPGWKATGQTFGAFEPDAPPSPDLAPVCRYYGRPAAGINSHFFSASASDCAYVAATWPESWQLETSNAFKVIPTANCGFENHVIARFYNNRADVNHRYVEVEDVNWDKPTIYQEMLDQGWIAEGAAWCAL